MSKNQVNKLYKYEHQTVSKINYTDMKLYKYEHYTNTNILFFLFCWKIKLGIHLFKIFTFFSRIKKITSDHPSPHPSIKNFLEVLPE